jgi:Sulfotransferase domain
MRYIFHLLGCEVKFTHAGQGTDFSKRQPGVGFLALDLQVLGEKNIFMYRNPLDTAVSMFFQIHKHDAVPLWGKRLVKYLRMAWSKNLPPSNIDKFVLHPVWGIENICRYNWAWLDYFNDKPDVLVIRYEEAKSDLSGVVEKFADILGLVDVDTEDIAKQSGFKSMKKLELKGKSRDLRLYGQKKGDPDTMKVRRGIIQGYRDYLTEETIATAEQIATKYSFSI